MSAMTAAPLASYRDSLAQDSPEDSGTSQPWLDAHRREAMASLRRLNFPQRREEAWRYTSVDRLLKHDFIPARERELPGVDIDSLLLRKLDSYRAVFVNGRFAQALSSLDGLPAGVTVGSLREQIASNPILPARWLGKAAGSPAHVFSALNTAAMDDGLFIHVARGIELERPIEVLHVTEAPADAIVAQPRCLLLLESGAQATLVERFTSPGSSLYFNNGLSEIFLLDGASLEHYRLQEESPAAFHLHSLHVNQQEHSHYRNTGFALGGAWSRAELYIDFLGTAATAELDGLYVTGEQQLSDAHLDIRHGVPGCDSRTNYRGLLHGRGRAVFDGRIEVSADAQKTNAHLHNANLLLSRNAEVDAKPQLEIYADDVRCSHGTTVGQLDPAQLFYLRSRGIETAEARRMLCLGFAGDVLDHCRITPLREHVEAAVSRRLAQASDGGQPS